MRFSKTRSEKLSALGGKRLGVQLHASLARQPVLPALPPLPPPYFGDIDVDRVFGNQRTFNFYAREELRVSLSLHAPLPPPLYTHACFARWS